MKPCVFVTEIEFEKSKNVFEAAEAIEAKSVPLEENALAEAVIANDCRAVVLGVDAYTGPLYEALGQTGGDNGAIIARFGVGHDGVDKQLAQAHNIVVTNTPGALDTSVAEHAVWLIGALSRQVAAHDMHMKSSQWTPSLGQEVRGKTLLIVGCGNIGRKVARIASSGFGMNVIAFDAMPLDATQMKEEFGCTSIAPSLDDALAAADAVSIHLPAIEQTRHFVDSKFLSTMKHDALLINTARGSIVDECALYDALKNSSIAGAALDVYEQEPYVPVDPSRDLRSLPQVVLTPHVGSSTTQACEGMANCCLKNIKAFFDGERASLDRVSIET